MADTQPKTFINFAAWLNGNISLLNSGDIRLNLHIPKEFEEEALQLRQWRGLPLEMTVRVWEGGDIDG